MLIEDIERRAFQALIPPPRLTLSEWIETTLRLPEGLTALPGPVRLWTPQKGIADAIGDPELERVTVVKPVRVGFTTLLTGATAAFVANEPAPIMVLLPTEADCRDYVVSDIEPVFEATPELRGKLGADADEAGRSTLLHRRFAGGSLKVVAAKAPRNLRRHNVRILIIDEADAMEVNKREGSPILLAERRTLSFANRKIVMGSTPIFEESSHVLRSYGESDRRVFEVPCPSCGAFTEIQWRHIEWQPDKPETAAFRCPECQDLIDERHKPDMVEAGRWRATANAKSHAGFRLNALISNLANAAWPRLVEEFLRAKNDPAELQVFTNTILAQGWSEGGEEIDETELQSRCEPFGLDRIPPEVLAVTAGVDVQDDRLEVTFLGWSREDEIYVLGHTIIWGGSDEDTTWAELDELSQSRFIHPYGGKLRIDAMTIDSGDGGSTDRVYSYCFPRLNRRILAIKGLGGARPVLQATKTKVKGGRLFLVGIDGIKTTLFNRLPRGTSIRFSDALEPVWFEQLTAEKKVVRYVRGQPVRHFERKAGARNEALDCFVYAYAARHGVNINFDAREKELRTGEKPPSRPLRRVRSRGLA